MKYSLFFLKLFIALSWITHPLQALLQGSNKGFQASNPLFRMTLGDLCGLFGIFLFVVVGSKDKIYFPDTIKSCFVFLFLLLPGLFVTPKPFAVFMEIFVLTFMILIAVIFINSYRHKDLYLSLFKLIIYSSLAAVFVGLWDLIAGYTSLPFIFKPRRFEVDGMTVITDGLIGEAKSGFRNAGQAGTYFLMIITILAPLYFSKLKKLLEPKLVKILSITLVLSIIFLVTTFKIAALLGFVLAIPIYAIAFRKKGFILGILSFILLGVLTFPSLETLAPTFFHRANHKVQTRVLKYFIKEYDNEVAETSTDFVNENYGQAFQAFLDNPLTGSGLGGFAGVYMKYEVHSTPMKLVGETGLLGIIGYIILMFLFLFHFVKAYGFNKDNPYRDYLMNMVPFIIGCFINWGYSFHLRQRIFWVLFAVVISTYYLMREWEAENKKILVVPKKQH